MIRLNRRGMPRYEQMLIEDRARHNQQMLKVDQWLNNPKTCSTQSNIAYNTDGMVKNE
jgi:hypothetical protein